MSARPLVARDTARIEYAAERAKHKVTTQVSKEIAAITAIVGCADAVDALPDTLPARHQRMAERIAIRTSRLVGRLAQ